jgi:hypothetical protein
MFRVYNTSYNNQRKGVICKANDSVRLRARSYPSSGYKGDKMGENVCDNSKCGHKEKIGERIGQSDHTGKVYLKNDWGADLSSLTVRHRRGNDPSMQEEFTFYNVLAGDSVGPMKITYTTGAGSPFDYWWVKFVTVNATAFSCKNDFYCYISSSDDGTVNLRLDGADSDMYVTFSESSGCYVGISEVAGKE